MLAAVYVATVLWVSRVLIRRERRFGRFAEVPQAQLPRDLARDARERAEREQRLTWIAQHLDGLQPELAGAIFHAKVGAPEVAALLARLEAEGQLAPAENATSGGHEIRLVAARETLAEHERALLDAAFFDGATTSMARIAARYRARGFSAANVLRAPLEQRATAIDGYAVRNEGASSLLLVGAALPAVFILNFSLFRVSIEEGAEEGWLGGATALATIACLLLGPWLARRFREDFVTPHGSWRSLRVFLALLISTFAYLLIEAATLSLTGSFLSFALAVLLTGWVTYSWWWRASPGVVGMRRRVGVARQLLEAQVADDVRVLEPKWRPHLIALDLSPADDCWLRDVEAPRAENTVHPTHVTFSSSSSERASSRSSDSSQSSSFSGGGGSFGGGGASGSW